MEGSDGHQKVCKTSKSSKSRNTRKRRALEEAEQGACRTEAKAEDEQTLWEDFDPNPVTTPEDAAGLDAWAQTIDGLPPDDGYDRVSFLLHWLHEQRAHPGYVHQWLDHTATASPVAVAGWNKIIADFQALYPAYDVSQQISPKAAG
jgi:hypothetical protein